MTCRLLTGHASCSVQRGTRGCPRRIEVRGEREHLDRTVENCWTDRGARTGGQLDERASVVIQDLLVLRYLHYHGAQIVERELVRTEAVVRLAAIRDVIPFRPVGDRLVQFANRTGVVVRETR